jgi:hypothetical protein
MFGGRAWFGGVDRHGESGFGGMPSGPSAPYSSTGISEVRAKSAMIRMKRPPREDA